MRKSILAILVLISSNLVWAKGTGQVGSADRDFFIFDQNFVYDANNIQIKAVAQMKEQLGLQIDNLNYELNESAKKLGVEVPSVELSNLKMGALPCKHILSQPASVTMNFGKFGMEHKYSCSFIATLSNGKVISESMEVYFLEN